MRGIWRRYPIVYLLGRCAALLEIERHSLWPDFIPARVVHDSLWVTPRIATRAILRACWHPLRHLRDSGRRSSRLAASRHCWSKGLVYPSNGLGVSVHALWHA